MADAISFYLDIGSPQGRIVYGLSDSTNFPLGPFYQGQLLKFRVYPVVPTGNRVSGPFFSLVALDTLEMQMVVGPAAGTEAIKAAQYTWSKQSTPDSDGESGYFYADLDLNTTDLNTLVGSSSSISTEFEILLSRAGATAAPVFQTSITIKAVVKGPASAASIPTPSALLHLFQGKC